MINHNMSKAVKVVPLIPYYAAGTTSRTPGGTNVTADGYLDTIGFEAVMAIATLQAPVTGAVAYLKATYSPDGTAANSVGDAAGSKTQLTTTQIAAAQAPAGYPANGPVLVLDIYEPIYRWVLFTMFLSTQNVVIDSVIAILYHFNNAPTNPDAWVLRNTLNGPLVGTA